MSARNDILAKINKRSKKIAEARDRSRDNDRPEKLVAEFIDAVESARLTARGGYEFAAAVEHAAGAMERRFQRLDPQVFIEVVWDREVFAEVWQDLRPRGVRVVWGEMWKRSNPDKDGEIFIGVEQLFLEGI